MLPNVKHPITECPAANVLLKAISDTDPLYLLKNDIRSISLCLYSYV